MEGWKDGREDGYRGQCGRRDGHQSCLDSASPPHRPVAVVVVVVVVVGGSC